MPEPCIKTIKGLGLYQLTTACKECDHIMFAPVVYDVVKMKKQYKPVIADFKEMSVIRVGVGQKIAIPTLSAACDVCGHYAAHPPEEIFFCRQSGLPAQVLQLRKKYEDNYKNDLNE